MVPIAYYLVLSAVPIRGDCSKPSATVDFFDVWRNGAYAIWIEDDGRFRIESVAETLGDRPWVLDRMRGIIPRRDDAQPDDTSANNGQRGSNQPPESSETDDP